MGAFLPFDSEAADFYANICARRRSLGRPIAQFGAQVAAFCGAIGAAALAALNVADFGDIGLKLINPRSTQYVLQKTFEAFGEGTAPPANAAIARRLIAS